MVIVTSTLTNKVVACYGFTDSITIDMLKTIILEGISGIGKDTIMANDFRSKPSYTGFYTGTIQTFINDIVDETPKPEITTLLQGIELEQVNMPLTVFAGLNTPEFQELIFGPGNLELIFGENDSRFSPENLPKLINSLAILLWLGVKTICDQLFAAIKPTGAECSSVVSVTSTDSLVGPYTTVAGVLGLTCYIANFWRSVAVGWKFRPGYKTVDKATTAKYITQNIIFLRIVLKSILRIDNHELAEQANELDSILTNQFKDLKVEEHGLLTESINKIAEIIQFRQLAIAGKVFTEMSGYPNYTQYMMPLFQLETRSRQQKLINYLTHALNIIDSSVKYDKVNQTSNVINANIPTWQEIPDIMSVFHSNMVSMYENNDTTIDFTDLYNIQCKNNDSIRIYIVQPCDFNRDEFIRIRIIAPLDCRAELQLFLSLCSIPESNMHIQEFVGTPDGGRAVTHVQFLVDVENTIGLLFELLKVEFGGY